ncbi:hypothetical protein [Halomonas sp.]|uniref:hypothetical protein n=1 Tax=Halomonas sp. TaxID=1486246 RepID=UPI003F994C31
MNFSAKLSVVLISFIALKANAETVEEAGEKILRSNISNEEICENIHNRAEGIMQLRQNGAPKEDMLEQVGHNEAFHRIVELAYQFSQYPEDAGMRRLTVERFANSIQESCMKEMEVMRQNIN